MAELTDLTIRMETTGAQQSFLSVLDNLAALGGGLELRVDLGNGRVVSSFELGDLFACEAVDLPAGGAGELKGLQLLPGDGYLELVTAIADRANCDVVFSHGWPILSVVARNTTVAEAGGGSNLPGGGLSA